MQAEQHKVHLDSQTHHYTITYIPKKEAAAPHRNTSPYQPKHMHMRDNKTNANTNTNTNTNTK